MSFLKRLPLLCLICSMALSVNAGEDAQQVHYVQSKAYKIRAEKIAGDMEHPWSIAFFPDCTSTTKADICDALITERSGQLRWFKNGRLVKQPVGGLPKVHPVGQGGLMDVAFHPHYPENNRIYLIYTRLVKNRLFPDSVKTNIISARFDTSKSARLEAIEKIFEINQPNSRGVHFGGRLLFDSSGYLYITLGDRGDRDQAQDARDHAGSLIRLHDDGRTPKDNPHFASKKYQHWLPEIYSIGHRNIQGITQLPDNKIIVHEHGPQGGDEINYIVKGRNYGWPVITYGVNYGIGTKIGEGTHKKGMEQPLLKWVPSIAPSGMTYYMGKAFAKWQGDLLVGALKARLLARVKINKQATTATEIERIDLSKLGRIRDVRVGVDGLVYVLTDNNPGGLWRLQPDSK